MGLSGFTLCVLDFYTGGRWSEPVGQERHEYDEAERAIIVRFPLKEVNGKLFKVSAEVSHERPSSRPEVGHVTPRRTKGKRGRTKTPAGTRPIVLPPSIAVFYETQLDSHRRRGWNTAPSAQLPAAVLAAGLGRTQARPAECRRSRPGDSAVDHFPRGTAHPRHLDGRGRVPQVARRARLGQKMKGTSRGHDHVTRVMKVKLINGLEASWLGSLLALRDDELATITGRSRTCGPRSLTYEHYRPSVPAPFHRH